MSDMIEQIPLGEGSRIGAGNPRWDGYLKVTGAARYAAEFSPPGLLHAAQVTSTIAAGRIVEIDTTEAESMLGVRLVLTHHNAAVLKSVLPFAVGGQASQSLLPLQDDRIRFSGQPIGLVVADTFEQATDAATRVRVRYHSEPFVADLAAATPMDTSELQAFFIEQDASRGDVDAALATAPVTVDSVYTTPRHYACAMEPHATVASWSSDGQLTVWESTQWSRGTQAAFAQWFDIAPERVRVISPFVGGGFGSKGTAAPFSALVAMAARQIGRPVKLVVTRPQVFGGTCPRPATRQRLRLGADTDGTLLGLWHECVNDTSIDDVYIEACPAVSKMTYAVPNLRAENYIGRINAVTPSPMRAPGEMAGTFALECAMDELAVALEIDPIELRLRNYAEHDPSNGKPWSTRALREAYDEGADAFGWKGRNPTPRSMRDGHHLIGWGMAGATYPCFAFPAAALVRARADGRVEVRSGGADLGTGMYTVAAQVAADVFAIPVSEVIVRLGDSDFPGAPAAGGSALSGSLSPVVYSAALDVRSELIELATALPGTGLTGRAVTELTVSSHRVHSTGAPDEGIGFAELLAVAGREAIEAVRDTLPPGATSQDQFDGFSTMKFIRMPSTGERSMHSWSSIFAEVKVDEELGTIRVSRLVGAFDCGRILNPITARSQMIGGMVMGFGAACLEASVTDPRVGRMVNPNLAEYMLPVNADIPDIEVLFVGAPDPYTNSLGSKAVGELSVAGVPAAIANAVYHATGHRVRDLPILMEKVL